MVWHNLTIVAQHLKCCFGHSEMPEQSLLSKYFCIIARQNCYTTVFPNSRHPWKQLPHSLCFVCSLWGTNRSLYMKSIIFSGFSHFPLSYLVTVYREVTILFSLTHRVEKVLIRKCFMRHSNFAQKLNLQLWMETWLLSTDFSFSFHCAALSVIYHIEKLCTTTRLLKRRV